MLYEGSYQPNALKLRAPVLLLLALRPGEAVRLASEIRLKGELHRANTQRVQVPPIYIHINNTYIYVNKYVCIHKDKYINIYIYIVAYIYIHIYIEKIYVCVYANMLSKGSKHPIFEDSGSNNNTVNGFGAGNLYNLGYLDPLGSKLQTRLQVSPP